jgi:hypothetical protein
MILSGLEFSISICDLNGGFPLHSCSVLVELLLALVDLVPVNHSLFEQSLDADDLRFTRCQRLVHYLAGTGLVASEGQG